MKSLPRADMGQRQLASARGIAEQEANKGLLITAERMLTLRFFLLASVAWASAASSAGSIRNSCTADGILSVPAEWPCVAVKHQDGRKAGGCQCLAVRHAACLSCITASQQLSLALQ